MLNTRNSTNDSSETFDGIKMYNNPKVVHEVDAYLDEEIKELPYYRNLLQFIRNMEPEDSLRIWISSPGGILESAKAIIEAILNTQGQVTCIIAGECQSAASLIALSAPQLQVQENAMMMIHHASGGISGKLGDIEAMVDFNRKTVRDTMTKCYSNFLTDAEIEQVFMGRDFYFNYDEIITRLENRQKILEAINSDQATPVPTPSENVAVEATNVVPKATRRRSKP